jgi:hypothetical protein
MEKANQAHEDKEITPQALHKRKLIAQDEARRQSVKVVEEYIEIISDHYNQKGGKVRLCKKMSNGNFHRLYIGREKQCKEYLLSVKGKGMKVVR